ncbi:amidase domain-containing protein [Kitasatospora sp. NBC_01250]|uniref:amidase domain-containing protein n=1 Tax=Kitasatospora sp. NBC_01250 TaxID=2903571 RepID=UPI002E30EF3F|nr:amidase domain-containing protein [Kitasatospora sp. NBC_01250]
MTDASGSDGGSASSAITLDQLKNAKPALWSTAANDWAAMAKHCWDASVELRHQATQRIAPVWSSTAGNLAQAKMSAQADALESAYDEMRGVVAVLDGAAEAFEVAQRSLGSALSYADQNGMTVAADGTVTSTALTMPHAHNLLDPSDVQQIDQQVDQTSWLIQQALTDARKADATAAAALTRLAGQVNVTDPSTALDNVQKDAAPLEVSLIAGTVPPAGTDPTLVAAWWNGLTPDQQQQLQLAVPASLAHLDGIPTSVQQQLIGTDGKFDRSKFIQWAMDNWDNTDLDTFDNNCTNFTSDALHAAGLAYKNDGDGSFGDNNWFKGAQVGSWGGPVTNWIDAHDHSHSRSWALAGGLHDFLLNNGSTTVPLSQARPGDIIFLQQAGPGPNAAVGDIHHACIITSITPDGDIHYTQHTNSYLNASLNTRLPSELQEEGQQNVVVVRVQPNW